MGQTKEMSWDRCSAPMTGYSKDANSASMMAHRLDSNLIDQRGSVTESGWEPRSVSRLDPVTVESRAPCSGLMMAEDSEMR